MAADADPNGIGHGVNRSTILGPDGDPARDRSPWPMWARHTLSAAAGVATAAITMTLAFGNVRRDAEDAKRDVAALIPRVTAVELKSSTDGAQAAERYASLLRQIDSLIKTQDEQRSDVKEILRRLPK